MLTAEIPSPTRGVAIWWLLALLLAAGCDADKQLSSSTIGPGTTENFKITIEQEGREVPIRDDVVRLRREPFVIVVHFNKPRSILLSASFQDETFRLAKTAKRFHELRGFAGTGIADYKFNPKRALFVHNTSPNMWYYRSPTNHRFDNMVRRGGTYICRRTVAFAVDLTEPARPAIPLEELVHRSIYLVAVSASPLTGSRDAQIEYQRRRLEIRFQERPQGDPTRPG